MMKSITFRIGYLLTVLVVDVSSMDYPFLSGAKKTQNSIYNFGYEVSFIRFLNIEITLKNIPPSVTTVTAIQITWDYADPQTKTGEVNIDKETREGKFMILESLTHRQILVAVLLNNSGRLCDETRLITEGRDTSWNERLASFYWDTTQRKSVFYYYKDWKYDATGSCFAPNACEIILDLTNACKAQPVSTRGDNVECHIEESQYICTFVRAAANYEDLNFCQTNEDNSVIGPLWAINQQKKKLYIKLQLELFDNNTSVKLGLLGTNKKIWSDTLSITAKDIRKASNVTILKFTETTPVRFSCEHYNRLTTTTIHVGFINSTDNMIKTHNTTVMRKSKFTMMDNGTILCCIVYEYEEGLQEITATRFVENKTLLVYQSHEPTSNNLKAVSNEQGNAACQVKWWLYLLLSLLGVIVLLLTIYIVMKQRCCTNSQPAEETVELYDNATTNHVLYANLDIVHNENRANHRTEESPYANIVGVLHPL